MRSLNIGKKVVVSSFALALCTTAFAIAGSGVQAEVLSCAEVRKTLEENQGAIVLVVNAELAGYKHKVSALKTVVINSVTSLRPGPGDCEVIGTAELTMKRKIRRDAHGTVSARSRITVDKLGPLQYNIVLNDPRVDDVNLSRTWELGEDFYEKAFNKKLREKSPIEVKLPKE